MLSKLIIRELVPKDAAEFREIRLEALKKHPEFFMSSYDEERELPAEGFKKRLDKQTFFGCFKEGHLLGIIGYNVLKPEKMAHTAHLGGFYVRAAYRGRGFAKKLFTAILDDAARHVEKITLVVNAKNKAAVRLYKSVGFKEYGSDKKALKVDGHYIDEIHMVKFF